jgi:preprotein translocase subunit SecA
MVGTLLRKVFGTKNERDIKRLLPLVEHVNSKETQIAGLSDTELKDKTGEFKRSLEEGKTLDDILPEAFALVREVSNRRLKMRHFDM